MGEKHGPVAFAGVLSMSLFIEKVFFLSIWEGGGQASNQFFVI